MPVTPWLFFRYGVNRLASILAGAKTGRVPSRLRCRSRNRSDPHASVFGFRGSGWDSRAKWVPRYSFATSNSQGELSPLEIGLHAWQAVKEGQGGRGKKGGIGEYADRIGKHRGLVTTYRQAAEVFLAIRETIQSTEQFLDKAKTLRLILRFFSTRRNTSPRSTTPPPLAGHALRQTCRPRRSCSTADMLDGSRGSVVSNGEILA